MCNLIMLPLGVFPLFSNFFFMYLGCEWTLLPLSLDQMDFDPVFSDDGDSATASPGDSSIYHAGCSRPSCVCLCP